MIAEVSTRKPSLSAYGRRSDEWSRRETERGEQRLALVHRDAESPVRSRPDHETSERQCDARIEQEERGRRERRTQDRTGSSTEETGEHGRRRETIDAAFDDPDDTSERTAEEPTEHVTEQAAEHPGDSVDRRGRRAPGRDRSRTRPR